MYAPCLEFSPQAARPRSNVKNPGRGLQAIAIRYVSLFTIDSQFYFLIVAALDIASSHTL